MAQSKNDSAFFKNWWKNRIIRTKILIGIFLGVFIYQSVTTTYQMQKVEDDILETYKEKALNLSVAVDCIMLKDGVLFFNLLDRISRTEVVGIQIDDNHPSCVERESFLQRMKASFYHEFEAEAASSNSKETPNEPVNQAGTGDEEEIEVIEEVGLDQGVEASIPLGLNFNFGKY